MKAKLFSQVGKPQNAPGPPHSWRREGSADTVRDPRGFLF